jgi:Rieske Fe-S protein
MRVGRRTFLGKTIILLLIGLARRVWAQASRFHRLARPVSVPLADLSAPRRARPFVAEAVTLPSAANPNQPIRISGMIIRTSAGDDRPDQFSAVCTRCPHEHCDVDFIADPGKLAAEVLAEIGRVLNEPVYLCPCHNSTFNTTDGERLSGPAPRGLYRFRVTSVSSTAIEIGEVEEDVLLFN